MKASTASALESTTALLDAIQGLEARSSPVIAFQNELEALCDLLDHLYERVSVKIDDKLSILNLPLLQCAKACKGFHQELVKCLSQPRRNSSSFRGWNKLTYKNESICDFKERLACYKFTIIICLTDTDLHQSTLSKTTYESHDNLVKSITEDLNNRLEDLEDCLEDISGKTAVGSVSDTAEEESINEERQSTLKCLEICTRFSEHLTKIQVVSDSNGSSPAWITAAAYSNFTIVENYGTGDNVQWMVSTREGPFRGCNRSEGFRNRQFGGSMDAASAQRISRDYALHAPRVQDTEDRSPPSRGSPAPVPDNVENTMAGAESWDHRGPGIKLSSGTSVGTPMP